MQHCPENGSVSNMLSAVQPLFSSSVYFHAVAVIRVPHLSWSSYFEQESSDTTWKTQGIICTANQNFHNYTNLTTNSKSCTALNALLEPTITLLWAAPFCLLIHSSLWRMKEYCCSLCYTDYIWLSYFTGCPYRTAGSTGSAAIHTLLYA